MGLQGGGGVIKSVLGGGVWKIGLGGGVHNPDPLRAQVLMCAEKASQQSKGKDSFREVGVPRTREECSENKTRMYSTIFCGRIPLGETLLVLSKWRKGRNFDGKGERETGVHSEFEAQQQCSPEITRAQRRKMSAKLSK